MATASKQPALKSQDLVVLLKFSCSPAPLTYNELSVQLGLAASQIHSSTKRLVAARLMAQTTEGLQVIPPAVKEFVLYGAKYCFPPLQGPATRGVATSYAAPPLNALVVHGDDLPPVWPHPDGKLRGVALYPLHAAVPRAAIKHQALYELLALFDALRSGAARERELAQKLLSERL